MSTRRSTSVSVAGVHVSKRRFGRRLPFRLAGIGILASGAGLALLLLSLRNEALASGERLTESFTYGVAEQATRTFQALDQRLRFIASLPEVHTPALSRQSGADLLRDEMREFPFVRALSVVDEGGVVFVSSEEGSIGLSLAERSYFQAYRDQTVTGFQVGIPLRSLSTGKWLITATRPLPPRDGVFAGLIVAAIRPEYFEDQWREIALGPQGTVTMFRRDGVLMMRSPFEEESMGKSFPGLPVFTMPLDVPSGGSFRATSAIDGIRRVFAYRALPERPELVVVVGRSVDGILAPWRKFATLAASIWILAWMVILPLTHFLNRARRHRLSIENRVRDSAQRLALATDAASIGVWDWDLKLDKWSATATYFTMLGYAPEEGMARGVWLDRVHPDDRTVVAAHVARALSGGEGPYKHEVRMRHADGSYRAVSVVGRILERDAAGKPARLLGVITDITEERRVRDALGASEARYRRLFESAKDGILIIDAATRTVVDVNPALIEMLGYSAEDFLGKSIWQVGLVRDLASHDERFAGLLESEYGRYDDLSMLAKDGQSVEVEAISVVYTVDGVKLIQSNIRDVSARKTAEGAIRTLHAELEERVAQRTAELEGANKELEAFSYSVSHDLRAPLRTMDAFSLAVVEDYGSLLPEEGQRYLGLIRQGAQRMGTLIDDLLSFSRLSRSPLTGESVNTNQLVDSVLDELAPLRVGRRISIVLSELPPCVGDPSLLRQVWLNLLSNAIKYTQKTAASRIEIGAEVLDGHDVYFVRDNGAGFDMRYVEKLFGVFHRLHRAEDYEGTGVGLAIVQRVIHRHGGRIWAEGSVDEGAVFRFTLNERTHV